MADEARSAAGELVAAAGQQSGAMSEGTTKRIVVHVACDPRTGVWSVMKSLARHQAGKGYTVHLGLLLPRDWSYFKELPQLGVPYLAGHSPQIFGTAQFLYHRHVRNPLGSWVSRLRSEAPGASVALHFHNSWLAGCLVLARPAGDRVRQIVTFHGIAGQEALRVQPVRRRLHRKMAQRLLSEGCALVSVDESNLAVAEELFGLEPSRFAIIPNGVSEVRPYRETAAHFGGPLRVGFLGVIQEGKGWHLVADAVDRLVAEGICARLAIAGSGPEGDTARAWCASRPQYASYLGYVSEPVKTLMPNLDVLCLMSRVEGFPMVVLEAMASGVVVVSTAVGGIPAAVEPGVTGFLVPRTSEALAGALARLARDRQLLRTLSRNAIDRVHNRYTLEIVSSQYEELYFPAPARAV